MILYSVVFCPYGVEGFIGVRKKKKKEVGMCVQMGARLNMLFTPTLPVKITLEEMLRMK